MDISQLFSGGILFIVVAVLIGLFFFWLRRRRSPKREQKSLLVTEDMRIMPISLPVELGYAVSNAWNQAWLIDPGIIIRRRGTTMNYSILDERDAAPQPITSGAAERRRKFDQMDDNKEGENEIDRIGRERGEEAITRVVTNQEKEKQAELLKTMALALLGTFIFIVVAMVAVNKFHGG